MAKKTPTARVSPEPIPNLFNIEIDVHKKQAKPILFAVCLANALIAYYSLKHTHIYNYYSLSLYDHELFVPIGIFFLHATLIALSLSSPTGYLIHPTCVTHWAASSLSGILQFFVWLFMISNLVLFDDSPTVSMFFSLSVWPLCFFRALLPEFGEHLPHIVFGFSEIAAFKASMWWLLIPSAFLFYIINYIMKG